MRPSTRATAAVVASLAAALVASPGLAAPAPSQVSASGVSASGVPAPRRTAPLPRTPEVATSTRLAERRSLSSATASTRWAPRTAATRPRGFHTRGEMGGFWTPPIKLLDGVWFGVDGPWLTGTALHQRLGLHAHGPRPHAGVTSAAPTSPRTVCGRSDRAAADTGPARPVTLTSTRTPS